jgi:hypothetical protein
MNIKTCRGIEFIQNKKVILVHQPGSDAQPSTNMDIDHTPPFFDWTTHK